MSPVVILIAALSIAVLTIGVKLFARKPAELFGLEARGSLFSAAERSFLGILEQSVDNRYRIFGKVRLGDLVRPAKELEAKICIAALKRLNQLNLDFVVCTANELAPVAVVVLDDQSTEYKDRITSDGFVAGVLTMAGIPLLRFQAQRAYTLQEVREVLAGMKAAR